MFICRLALGAHTPVPQGYSDREPPVRDATRILGVGVLKFDCTTNGHPKDRRGDRMEVRDGRKLPEIVVTYHDQQAVADYLVTFQFSK